MSVLMKYKMVSKYNKFLYEFIAMYKHKCLSWWTAKQYKNLKY